MTSNTVLPPSVKLDNQTEEYAVEKILDKRLDSKTNKAEYLIQWKGFSE